MDPMLSRYLMELREVRRLELELLDSLFADTRKPRDHWVRAADVLAQFGPEDDLTATDLLVRMGRPVGAYEVRRMQIRLARLVQRGQLVRVGVGRYARPT